MLPSPARPWLADDFVYFHRMLGITAIGCLITGATLWLAAMVPARPRPPCPPLLHGWPPYLPPHGLPWPSMAFHGLPSHGHPSYPVQVPSCRFGIANACAAFSLRRGDTPFGNVVVLRLIVAPLWCARICPSCPHPALAAGHPGLSARSDLSGLWPLCPLWPLRPLRPWLAMCTPAKHHTRCSAGRA